MANKPYPIWFTLLRSWNDLGRYGLTLPFLMGAIAHTKGQSQMSANDAEEILTDMINNPVDGYIVNIRWCDNISSVVFEIQKHGSNLKTQDRVIEFKNPNTKEISVLVYDRVTYELKAKQNDVLTSLINQIKDLLERGYCSKFWTEDGLEYGPLQPEELEFINKALEKAS